MKVGLYRFSIPAIPEDSAGLSAVITRLGTWPHGKCVRIGLDASDGDVLGGEEWIGRDGKTTSVAWSQWEWPGEALKDAQGRVLCVPMKSDKALIVKDTLEARAEAQPLTKEQIKAAPDGVHAFIRKEIRPAAATLFVEVLQEIEVDVVFEAI